MSPSRRAWQRFRRHLFGLAGLVVLALLTGACLSAGWLAAANAALDAVGGTAGGEMPTGDLPDAWRGQGGTRLSL